MTVLSAEKGKPIQPREIEIYIEELALEGIPASERYAISDALRRELELLLRERGTGLLSSLNSSTGGGEDRAVELTLGDLSAGSISLKESASSDDIGKQVAQAVFGSLHSSLKAQRVEFARSDDGLNKQDHV